MTIHTAYLRAATLTLLVRRVSSAICSSCRHACTWVASLYRATAPLVQRAGLAFASVAFACRANGSIPDGSRSLRSNHRSRSSNERDIVIPPLTQEFLDRCNLAVDRMRSGQEATMDEHLQEIGKRVRAWRIWSGYTRADLAEQIGVDREQLLFVETGIGLPGDMTSSQLLHLQVLLRGSDQGRGFAQLVQEYLVAHCNNSDLLCSDRSSHT